VPGRARAAGAQAAAGSVAFGVAASGRYITSRLSDALVHSGGAPGTSFITAGLPAVARDREHGRFDGVDQVSRHRSCERLLLASKGVLTDHSMSATISSRLAPLHGDNDLASGLALVEVPDGRCGLAERVCPVDGRRDFPRFEELSEDRQVRGVLLRTEDA
jgi:hypothetical protein